MNNTKKVGNLSTGAGDSGGRGKWAGNGSASGNIKLGMKQQTDWTVGDVTTGKGGAGGNAYTYYAWGQPSNYSANQYSANESHGGNAGPSGNIDIEEN